MNFAWSILTVVSLVIVAAYYVWRLRGEENAREAMQWLRNWGIKGLGVPIFLWMIFNLGGTPVLPPLVTPFVLGKGGLSWFTVVSPGLMVISTYWCAVTVGWVFLVTAAHLEQRRDLTIAGLVWCAVLTPVIWSGLRSEGWEAGGAGVLLCLIPVAHYTAWLISQQKPVDLPPVYSQAIAKMKFGKYEEAEAEVIQELERHQDDFDGWMMLAELYATQFQDFEGAERTVFDLCTHSTTTAAQVSVALHRLADWHIKLREDPTAARRVLEEICTRLPGTHLAHMARLRINQLPANTEELREQSHARTIRMPALNDQLGNVPVPSTLEIDRKEAGVQANKCVEKLKQNPNDTDAREKLARILAEQLGNADAALDQLQLLLNMPEQPDGKMAEWLALGAAWHLAYRQDAEAARKYLRWLLDRFPDSPQAFAAQQRLEVMNMEARLRNQRVSKPNVEELMREAAKKMFEQK